MSYEDLQGRFEKVQTLQGDFLNRIREYRTTRDPSILPDIQDANKLDDELEDIARELSHGDADPPQTEVVISALPVSVQRRRRPATQPVAKEAVDDNMVPLDLYIMKRDSDDNVKLTDAPPQRASPTGLPAAVPLLDEQLLDATTDKSVSLPSLDDDIPLGGTAESLQNTPRSRRKKRLDSFVVMNNASEVAVQRVESPVVVPTFGEVIKNAVDHGEIVVGDSESSVPETYDEPPPTFRKDPTINRGPSVPAPIFKVVESLPDIPIQESVSKKESLRIESIPVSQILAASPVVVGPLLASNEPARAHFPPDLSYVSPTPPASPPPKEPVIQPELTYASPTPPSSPPKANTEIRESSEPAGLVYRGIEKKGSSQVSDRSDSENEKIPTPRKAYSPAAFDPRARSPARNFSPLGRSNERRRTSMTEEDQSRYWRHVRAERERYEKILSTISQIKEVQDQLKKDFTQTRVKAVGITGDYLFRPRQTPGLPEKVATQSSTPGRSAPPEDEEIIEVPDIPPEPPAKPVIEVPPQGPADNQQGPISPEDAARQEAPTAWSSWIAGLMDKPKAPEETPVVITEPLAVGSPTSRRRRPSNSQSETVFGVPVNAAEAPAAPSPANQAANAIMAVLTIQKWFRRWRAIRKERLASMASMAEVEAVNAREALRQRRRARSRSANRDAWNVQAPTAQPEQEEIIEVVD